MKYIVERTALTVTLKIQKSYKLQSKTMSNDQFSCSKVQMSHKSWLSAIVTHTCQIWHDHVWSIPDFDECSSSPCDDGCVCVNLDNEYHCDGTFNSSVIICSCVKVDMIETKWCNRSMCVIKIGLFQQCYALYTYTHIYTLLWLICQYSVTKC